MRLPHADLPYIEEQLDELSSLVREAWDAAGPFDDELNSPLLLRDAIKQLLRHLGRIQDNTPGETDDNPIEISTLGEYGLHLLDEMSSLAQKLDQNALANEVTHLSLPFALWIARNGGEIRSLTPVVEALAHFANQQAEPHVMSGLYNCCCELIEATSPACEDCVEGETENPWRLLLLNRAIVATRSHNPELMEVAFDAIVEQLPADADAFFAQGMEQIAVIDYPETVCNLVRRYYLLHAKPKQLH